jgi:hypothetical protein
MNSPFGIELELKLNGYICIACNKNDPTCNVLKRNLNIFVSRASKENNTIIPPPEIHQQPPCFHSRGNFFELLAKCPHGLKSDWRPFSVLFWTKAAMVSLVTKTTSR